MTAPTRPVKLPDHPDVREDYTLKLVAATALCVGAPSGDGVTDLPLATDGQGRLLVPGTSWAGVLRAAAGRHLPDDSVCSIFGYQDNADGGHASRLFVSDSVVAVGQVELRNGVGIDRRRAAAAERLLYDRLVLPAGTELALSLRYEGPSTGDLANLIGIVRAAGLWVGAATGRGLGRLDCTSATTVRTSLTSRSAVLALLGRTAKAAEVKPAQVAASGLRFEITWSPTRPVVVGGPAAGENANLVPVLTASGTGLAPLLPGSSVKGVLRGAAERAIRTVLDDRQPPDPDAVKALDALARRVPVHGEVFGSRDRRGALSIADTVASTDPVSPDDWLLYVSGKGKPGWLDGERTHVAIDRWTGGAAEHRLFTVQETAGVRWPPLVLELDPRRVTTDRRRAAVVLLGVTIGLLLDGLLGFGHGTTRGLGELEIKSVTVGGAESFGLPAYRTGDDWWAWLREIAGGADLVELLTEADQRG